MLQYYPRVNIIMHMYNYVLLKALPPVCMVYTARGESQVANIARGRVLYLSRDSHQELYIPYKQSGSALSVLLYFALTKCQLL